DNYLDTAIYNQDTLYLTLRDGSTYKVKIVSSGEVVGIGLEYDWDGTRLGAKREDEQNYDYTDHRGPQGQTGPTGLTGEKGDGWTGGSYNTADGKVTFSSDDGLGFQTGDLRGTAGKSVEYDWDD